MAVHFLPRPGKRVALSGSTRLFWLATLVAGLGWSALAPQAGMARMYDPATVPKARYVAPLAPWPQPSYRAKDFTILRKEGWYHLFYTRVQRFVPHHWSDGTRTILNETTFGHAISPDLESWFEMDSVLTVSGNPNNWDAHHVWAPSVVEHDGRTFMFYTGVRDRQESTGPTNWVPRWQVIGAAYSTDPLLQEWVRLPTPIWSPCPDAGLPGVSWALCNATLPLGSADFRDAFALPPAAGTDDPWLLFYTARPRNDQFNYVAGVAQAASPLGPWSDLGALWDTYYPPLNSKVESPHVFRRGDDWHLFFTGDDGTTGIAWHTSAGMPLGPWEARPPLRQFLDELKDHPYEFTLEPEQWFASEHFSEPTPTGVAEYLAVVHSYDAAPAYNPPPPGQPDDISIIEFRRMEWDDAAGTFHLVAPNPVRSMAVSRTSLDVGETVELTLLAEGGSGHHVEFEVSIERAGQVFPIDPGDVGLPVSVALAEVTSVIPWTVQAAPFAPPYTMKVTVANQPLRLVRRIDILGPPSAGEEPHPAAPPVTRATPGARVIAMGARNPPGAAPALDLDLPAAGRVRIALYDATGRHVRTLVDQPLEPGRSTWTWDGRDESGRPAPRGLYFARLTSSFGVRTARLLSLR